MEGLNFYSILTTLQERILESTSRDLTRKQVAQVLGVTKSSVTDNIRSLKEKLEADNLKQLIKNAIASGLIGKPSNWVRGATLPPHNPFMGPPGTPTLLRLTRRSIPVQASAVIIRLQRLKIPTRLHYTQIKLFHMHCQQY